MFGNLVQRSFAVGILFSVSGIEEEILQEKNGQKYCLFPKIVNNS